MEEERMFGKLKERRILKDQKLKLEVILLGRLVEWTSIFAGDYNVDDVKELAERMKGVNQEDFIHEMVKQIKDKEEQEKQDDLEEDEDDE